MTAIAPNSLDHVALWVADREPLAAFVCDHLGMHVIEETETSASSSRSARRAMVAACSATQGWGSLIGREGSGRLPVGSGG